MRFVYMTLVVPATVSVPLFLALIYYRRLLKPEKVMTFFLVISGIINAVGCWISWHRQNNLYLLHIYTCIELLFICLFFGEVFDNKRMKKWLVVLALIYIAAAISNSILLQDINKFNTYARSVSAIITISFCLYYYKTKLAMTETYRWRREPVFWFVTGFLIYFSSSLFLFILSNFTLVMNRPLAWTLWNIHATMVLIMYLLFAAGFWYAKSNR
jgi:hypothetical protein